MRGGSGLRKGTLSLNKAENRCVKQTKVLVVAEKRA